MTYNAEVLAGRRALAGPRKSGPKLVDRLRGCGFEAAGRRMSAGRGSYSRGTVKRGRPRNWPMLPETGGSAGRRD